MILEDEVQDMKKDIDSLSDANYLHDYCLQMEAREDLSEGQIKYFQIYIQKRIIYLILK